MQGGGHAALANDDDRLGRVFYREITATLGKGSIFSYRRFVALSRLWRGNERKRRLASLP